MLRGFCAIATGDFMPATPRPQVLVIGSTPADNGRVDALLTARGLDPRRCALTDPTPSAAAVAGRLALLLLDEAQSRDAAGDVGRKLAELRELQVPTVVWTAGCESAHRSSDGLDILAADSSLEEVVGRLTTLAQYVPLVRCLDDELRHMQRLSEQLNRYISELDREMRLAGRLQRDFMPRILPTAGRLRFSAVFRPASFVSGDIFDVIQIDESHVGMFIADAMGHGTAAGLITMFLRKSLVPMFGVGSELRIATPAQVMAMMHDGLARHELPNSNFVTAAYAVVNSRTMHFQFARGGHPYPLLIHAGGEIEEIRAEGGLMGLAEIPPEFEETCVQLRPRDKVIFYTDGLEALFLGPRDSKDGPAEFTPQLVDWARHDLSGFIGALEAHLDRQEGSLNPEDDITVVAMEVSDSGPPAA
ncbi:MAG: hypothetical protein AMXMBFR47_42650 [Planctomycetota bacterium]